MDNEAEIGSPPLQQLEAATLDGSVFVVRDEARLIAAITGPEPTVGLVFYDLKTALRQSVSAAEASKPRRTRKKTEPDAATSEHAAS